MSHALLAPSGAYRWSTCTASVPAIQAAIADGIIPAESTSEFAEEGVVAHSFAALALESKALLGVDYDYDNLIPDKIMASHVKAWVELVMEQSTSPSDSINIETKTPLFYSPKDNGTVDADITTDDCLVIADFKYGVGVSVEVKNNPQLTIYAESKARELGLYTKLGDKAPQFAVRVIVFQPRAREGEPVRIWDTTLGELGMLATTLGARARFIERHLEKVSPENNYSPLKFEPSKSACQFCPIKGCCAARAAWATEPLDPQKEFSDPADVIERAITQATNPALMTDETIARVVEAHLSKKFTNWLNSVEEFVLARMQAGAKFPGFKLVLSSKHRVWVDEEAAKKLLLQKLEREDVLDVSLITPAQALKALPKDLSTKYTNKLEALIEKPPGAPVLALADDERPEAPVITAQAEFADLATPAEDDSFL